MSNKKRLSGIMSRMAAIVLAMALVLTSLVPAATVDTYAKSKKAKTSITGYSTVINKQYSSSVKIKANISPAGGRKVKLQRYNSSSGKWKTIKTAKVKKGSVSFSIPKKQRKKTTSVWRIYAPATGSAESATSSKITLTTRNIKNAKMTADAACIYRIDPDGGGTLIYTKNADQELAMASTTKLMTAILLVESGLMDSTTKISKHAANTPYASGKLKKGDKWNTGDLLYAMLLPSSNDAATAVAEKVGGSESAFAGMMNARARKMGLTHTQFKNPHGLDASGHYTTATELAKITALAYSYPEIRDCMATKSKTIKSLKKKISWTLWSTNAIFSYVKEFLGGKTGTESNAGCCFTGIYSYHGSTYVTVVLGSEYGFARWADTKALHKYIRKYADKKY